MGSLQGFGQWIVRVDATANPDITYDYYYNDQWQLLTETAYDGTPVAVYHWHPFYVDALAVRMTATSTHFFLQDANFNVTAAVDDATNAVVERYAYTPYGEVTFLEDDFDVKASQTSAIGNTHLYTGRERDPETGLQLNRHRYYASHLGRWLTRDPIGYEGSQWNLVEYVGSTPANGLDPSGKIRPIVSGTGWTVCRIWVQGVLCCVTGQTSSCYGCKSKAAAQLAAATCNKLCCTPGNCAASAHFPPGANTPYKRCITSCIMALGVCAVCF